MKALGFLMFLQEAAPTGEPAMDFSVTEMIKHLYAVGIIVVIILLLMSMYSIAIMVERFLTYSAA